MIAFHHSSAVRLAAIFFLLFTCTVAVAFAATYWMVRGEAVARLRSDLAARADLLVARMAREPADVALSDPSGSRVGALFDAYGRLLAGRPGLQPLIGWREIPAADAHLDEVGDDRSESVLLFGRRLGDGILVVGEGMHVSEDIGEALLTGLLSSLSFVAFVGFAGAIIIAWRVDRRLRCTEEALTAYAAGKMSRRLPVTGSHDELDRMALAVNTVLDRVAGLVETIRQVTTDAAHDLKTPMTRLRHRLAEAEGAADAEVKAVVGAAAADAEQIVATFDALLRIAQIEAGARRERFADVNLSEVLETIADAYAPDAEQSGQRLKATVAAGLHVTGDRELLTQAFANLVENAIRHAGKGAQIRVTGDAKGASVEAGVADTGPGVPAKERERVLRRFVRLEASRSTQGTGLGLTLVGAVADLHGATLVLRDNEPGLRVTLLFAQDEPLTHEVRTKDVVDA
jgi:signal transduction histidine kinase